MWPLSKTETSRKKLNAILFLFQVFLVLVSIKYCKYNSFDMELGCFMEYWKHWDVLWNNGVEEVLTFLVVNLTTKHYMFLLEFSYNT